MAALLLDHGADVDERIRLLEGVEFDYDPDHGNDGKTALILAAGKKFVGPAAEMVTLLLERGASVNAVGTSTWTALMEAASAGNAAAVRSLLTHGSDATARSRDGRTAQAIAEDFGRPQVADLLRAADGEGGR
jgi:ankyrin repeat protein